MQDIIQNELATNGFSTRAFLDQEYLEEIKNILYDNLVYMFQLQSIGHANKLMSLVNGLEYYHLADFNNFDHAKIWGKNARVLGPNFVKWFKKSRFWQKLVVLFGDIEISDEDRYGWPNIYWRLVRPYVKSDVGPLHRDSWFWELNKDTFLTPEYPFKRIKVWIPIIIEEGKNGLLVSPKSHQRFDIEWHGEHKQGKMKPILDTELSSINTILLDTKPAQAVIFDDDLMHGGALNNGDTTRVSIEFTILQKKVSNRILES